MIRTLCFTLVATLAFCSQAKAEFIIDYFKFVDATANDATSTLVHVAGGGNISVEASTTGGTLFNAVNQFGYSVAPTAMGDTFTLSYTWNVPTFNDLQSISGLELASIPHSFGPGWNLDLSTNGVVGSAYSGTALAANGAVTATPIVLDTATELTFTYTWALPTVPLFGATGFFGGPGAPLFATPEPTTFAMLGTVGLLGLVRRRRKS